MRSNTRQRIHEQHLRRRDGEVAASASRRGSSICDPPQGAAVTWSGSETRNGRRTEYPKKSRSPVLGHRFGCAVIAPRDGRRGGGPDGVELRGQFWYGSRLLEQRRARPSCMDVGAARSVARRRRSRPRSTPGPAGCARTGFGIGANVTSTMVDDAVTGDRCGARNPSAGSAHSGRKRTAEIVLAPPPPRGLSTTSHCWATGPLLPST